MIQRFNTRPSSPGWVRRLTALSVISLASVSLLGASGCDTVATISFSERGFKNLYPLGVSAPGGQCEGINGNLAMRFVMLANDETPITNDPQELVNGVVVNMNANAVKLSNGILYSTPDELCLASSNACEETNFVCPASDTSLASRCQKPSTISMQGTPKFLSDNNKNHLFGVLAENSGSLRGWMPSDVGALYPVKVGEGSEENKINGSADPGPAVTRATDNNKRRVGSVLSVMDNFNTASSYARESGRTALFGLWTFAESSGQVLSQISSDANPDQVWASQPTTVNAARDRYEKLDPSSTRANVYEATLKVLEQGYADDQYSDYSKTLVVFVDGPDDFRRSSVSTVDAVTQRAVELGVRLFIVHLDPRLSKFDTLRDDQRYYEQQSEACASDDACKNFEECRFPQTFTSSSSNPSVITVPPNYDKANPKKYCLPKRDENGRIGPIEDYASMTCATSGGYIYVPSVSGLRPQMEWLPYAMDGLWEVSAELPDSADSTLRPGGAYRLEATMTATLAGETRTVEFSRLGLAVTGDEDSRDNRPVFFKKP